MKLQRDKFDTIVFDMDGVITSEYSYWDAAALTVYELLYSKDYYGKQELDRTWCMKRLDQIFDIIFCGERTIQAVKRLGVNTNWDLAYAVFCVSKYIDPYLETLDTQHFESVAMFLESTTLQPPELYVALEGLLATVLPAEVGYYKRGDSDFWDILQSRFQLWFHGDHETDGTKIHEVPLLPLEEIRKTLQSLKDQGYSLGIGTGRPRDEIEFPLKKWGLYDLFDPAMIATYNEVLQAEQALNIEGKLAKPHPYIFRKAVFGSVFTDSELLEDARLPKDMIDRSLIVGDSISDLLSAQGTGFPFAAVLTGIGGKSDRPIFEDNQATLIFDSILEMEPDYENQP